MKKFKDVQKGDWIFTIHYGWEKVFGVADEQKFGYHTNDSEYDRQGKEDQDDLYPSAWTYNPFDPNDLPPCDFKKGQIIAVRDDPSEPWGFRPFDKFENKNWITMPIKGLAFASSWNFARELTSKEKGL